MVLNLLGCPGMLLPVLSHRLWHTAYAALLPHRPPRPWPSSRRSRRSSRTLAGSSLTL